MNRSVSPSRTYVAMCSKTNFDGYYFRRFVLPIVDTDNTPLANTTSTAAWYFLNRLNFTACIDGCITAEDFGNVTEQPTLDEVMQYADSLIAGM